MSFISGRYGQFAYFDRQLGRPDWRGKRVLDFGGNAGNILDDPTCTIDPRLYWSLDVSRDAIARGKQLHPASHFAFYDRYNPEFNPEGVEGLGLPRIGEDFDLILALSVFTHTSRAERVEIVGGLLAMLGEGGRLAFTILDPRHIPPDSDDSNLRHFVRKYHEDHAGSPTPDDLRRLERASDARRCTLVDESLYVDVEASSFPPPPPDGRTRYLTLCTPDEVKEDFPTVEVIAPVVPFPRHHCCILGRPTRGGRVP